MEPTKLFVCRDCAPTAPNKKGPQHLVGRPKNGWCEICKMFCCLNENCLKRLVVYTQGQAQSVEIIERNQHTFMECPSCKHQNIYEHEEGGPGILLLVLPPETY